MTSQPQDHTVRDFFRDGYVRLGKAISEGEIERLRARAEALMLGDVVRPGMFFQHDSPTGLYEDLTYKKGWVGPSRDYRKLEKLELDDVFRCHIDRPLFASIVGALIDGPVAVYRATLFNKSERGGSPLPWHQDGGKHWGVAPAPFLQVWTALDDCVLDGGCLQVAPGSHIAGLDSPIGGVVQDAEEKLRDASVVSLVATAGEVILLHNNVWHRAGINRSGAPRRTVSVCYMTASTQCLRKRHAPREFYQAFIGQ